MQSYAMSRSNRRTLDDRVAEAAERLLALQEYVSAADVLVGIGWLDSGAVRCWRQGRIDCLEEAIQTNPARIVEALRLLRSWAAANGLVERETHEVARTPQRQTLRFSMSGEPAIERLYRINWVSRALPQAKRERLVEKVNRAPDLLVIQPLNKAWTCHRCGGTGDLLMMENPGPACLRCGGLGDLEFLPAGDALLTRRVKAKSATHAVVVRFSRRRRRYERQGLLVEPQVLADTRRELDEQRREQDPPTADLGRLGEGAD
jgi:hypothetical protein